MLAASEELPSTGLVKEDGGVVPPLGGVVPVFTTLYVGTELEEFVVDGDRLVPLPTGAVGVFGTLAVDIELGEPAGEDAPVLMVKGMKLKVPVFVGEEEIGMIVVDIEQVVPVGDNVMFVLLPDGPYVPPNVGTELPESVGEEAAPMSVDVVIELPESVWNDILVLLVVDT